MSKTQTQQDAEQLQEASAVIAWLQARTYSGDPLPVELKQRMARILLSDRENALNAKHPPRRVN